MLAEIPAIKDVEGAVERYLSLLGFYTIRLMDRPSDYGSESTGSTPVSCTILIKKENKSMYKHVYNCFEKWYNDNRGGIWFYSDPHFSDEEMVYLRKDYIGDAEQVARINSKVGKHDTLIILGDIGNPEWLKKIHAHIVLILGNHDSGATNYSEYADEVFEGPLFISDKILLSHEPINYPYGYNIHGHDHSNWSINERGLNVCAEHIDYTPVSLRQIVKSGALKNIKDIHRYTIDYAALKKKI